MNRMILRSTAVVLVTAILLGTPSMAFADSGGDGYVETANGYQIELVFKEPAIAGENEFHIQITDSMGMPVPNAEVEVSCQPVAESSTHEESADTESHEADSMSGMDMSVEAPAVDDTSGMDMATEAPATGVMRPNNESDAHGTELDVHEEEPITIMLEPALESGEYSGQINFDKSGEWVFNVHFTVNDEMTAVEIPVEVARALGLNYTILAGFFGINATVIVVAASLKRKPLVIRK
ncbi:MAG: FixH family protein [Chloroflexi bacterium]|nr:FixH family protein [Chloroflexota bacterium]MBI3167522.1 FixH family protein [Chloroflexota bacterium]